MTLKSTKPIYDSLTVRANVVTLVSFMALIIRGFFGTEVMPDEADALVNGVLGIVGMAGALTSIYGRVKATKRIK